MSMQKNESKELGQRVKALREKAGLTQQQLAVQANLSVAGVAKLEQGRAQPHWETAVALADALGISLDEFRNGSQPPKKRG